MLETLSFASYVVLFRAVLARSGAGVDLSLGYDNTMAGVVATRLFAAAGAGGVVLTTWAVRRAGMARAAVTSSVATLLVLLYGIDRWAQ